MIWNLLRRAESWKQDNSGELFFVFLVFSRKKGEFRLEDQIMGIDYFYLFLSLFMMRCEKADPMFHKRKLFSIVHRKYPPKAHPSQRRILKTKLKRWNPGKKKKKQSRYFRRQWLLIFPDEETEQHTAINSKPILKRGFLTSNKREKKLPISNIDLFYFF